MSGGHFDYQQYKLDDIADEIEKLIERSILGEESWLIFNDETLKEFQNAIEYLRIAAIYAQRIDWLVSGDDGEQTFHTRLKEELSELNPLFV